MVNLQRVFKSVLILSLCFCSSISFADRRPTLNRVKFRLHAEQWASTKTAKVTVRVNASLSDSGLAKIHQDIMKKLSQLSNQGSWHVTNFNRSQDQSGLERVLITAQARLPETALTNLRSTAKSLTKPGEKFTVQNIEFKPSVADIENVREQLRQKIYQKASAEIKRLNSVDPKQHYQLHAINFTPIAFAQPRLANQAMFRMQKGMGAASDAAFQVSDKVTVNAMVTLAEKMNG